MKSITHRLKDLTRHIPRREKKPIRPEQQARIDKAVRIFNKYSLLFHIVLSCLLCFIIECISRRSFPSAFSFADEHTKAYIYNSFIIFASLSLVYLIRRRLFARVFISGFWLFLGTVNGLVLAKRVTPFGYTDLKCIQDLLSMSNTKYFTTTQAVMVVSVVALFLILCILLFVKGPKFQGSRRAVMTPILVAGLFFMLPITTKAAQNSNILDSYFSNIAQGYENYGFVYGFSTSVVDRGMKKPSDYSEEKIETLLNESEQKKTTNKDDPNIIVVLLESFMDPTEFNNLNLSEDPVPNFHQLEKKYTSGYLTVPVVGAGTANSEFEVLTGMSMQYFGTGEYPYKTILKKTNCESIASNLSKIGYGTHVVHNNGGNFYSRANAFSMMGFDSFTSKELMNIQEYTPLGDWPTDNILISETEKALDATPNQSDLVYTITVQGHGDYPTEKILENPEIKVSGGDSPSEDNQCEYYVNMIHEVDKFIKNLIDMLSKRDENTMVVFFGDHLPTMGLENSDMKSHDIFKTKYVTWNNFGLKKEDADLKAYELLANTTNQLGIHEGTVFTYEQNYLNKKLDAVQREEASDGLENLQYDILYGKRYAYHGEDLYPATDIIMGVEDVNIDNVYPTPDEDTITISGSNFTKWSKVFVNGKKVSTKFLTDTMLTVKTEFLKDGDTIVVNQLGSEDTIFRSSNEIVYSDPNAAQASETEEAVTE